MSKMQATVTFQLSAAGQKDALARGLPAQQKQTMTIPVTPEDVQYFSVQPDGSLTLDLHYGAGVKRDGWGSGWQHHTFDTYPSPEDILTFLRTREERRAAVIAAEESEKERKAREEQERRAAAYTAFCALPEEEQEKKLNTYYKRAEVDGVFLGAEQFPAVAAALERHARKQQAEKERQERRKQIPGAPKEGREVELQPDGTYLFTCPEGKYSESWAKKLSGVDPAKHGGYALEGTWLKSGERYRATAGDVIAVGSKQWQGSRKRGSYVTDFTLYVVTPIRLVRVKLFNMVSPAAAADLLAQTSEERVENAIKKLIADCEKCLADLVALDRAQYPEEGQLIDERTAAWQALKDQAEKALAGADPESNITDIDSAAAAIVTAGYRELAKRYHPDAGGSAEVMALLNTAKRQLVEILAAAKGE